ncbi:hypothetical protein GCM10028791_29760 [Echinicola sediminis]
MFLPLKKNSSVKVTLVMNGFNKYQANNNLPLLPPRADLETKELLGKRSFKKEKYKKRLCGV